MLISLKKYLINQNSNFCFPINHLSPYLIYYAQIDEEIKQSLYFDDFYYVYIILKDCVKI